MPVTKEHRGLARRLDPLWLRQVGAMTLVMCVASAGPAVVPEQTAEARPRRRPPERVSGSLEIVPTRPAGPAWSHNLPIYEINPRQFTREGTFKAIERHLPRLKKLGVGILWLMPIHPSGNKKSFGSFYCVKDFRDVNPESSYC